jgi:hypothetical protein
VTKKDDMADHPDTITYLVFSNPVEGKEDEFNTWYDTVHLPEVFATPGMRTAQRFKIREADITHNSEMAKPTHRYLLVYEMDDNVDEIMGKIREAATSGVLHMSDSLDVMNVLMSFWTPLGPKIVKEPGVA